MAKPILVSGIQPTGRLHIGNYLGALKNFVELQNSGKYQCYFFIVDLHSLTEIYDYKQDHNPKEKQQQIFDLAGDFLAVGIDPKRSIFALQSMIPAHSELTWILSTLTPMGELERMTQFKDKSDKHGANVGLFTYPVLMTSDIILYSPKYVPVGDDQSQHVELTRALVRKFNAHFGKTFIEPETVLTSAPRVMSLSEPERKMSKSIPSSCLFLDDSPEEVMQKVKRAVTDSGNEVRLDKEKKPAIANLLTIYSTLSGKPIRIIEKQYEGKGYGQFKQELALVIIDHFAEFRKKKAALMAKPDKLKAVLIQGSKKANAVANKKMAEVKKRIGIALEK